MSSTISLPRAMVIPMMGAIAVLGSDLKAPLQQVRPNVAAHFERARSVQGTLGWQ